jgi:hypothetical protein
MTFTPDTKEIDRLLSLTDDALLTALGMHALPLVETPTVTLDGLKSEEFTVDAALGVSNVSKRAMKIARRFFALWGAELETAICKNTKLYEEVRARGLEESHLVVAAVVAAIIVVTPQLALLGGLLTVLGVMVAKAGIEAFCKLLKESRSRSAG